MESAPNALSLIVHDSRLRSVEYDIGEDNPARAIGVYVDLMVDVGELGFKHGAGAGGAGQPADDPADLLKLDLYGDEIVGVC